MAPGVERDAEHLVLAAQPDDRRCGTHVRLLTGRRPRRAVRPAKPTCRSRRRGQAQCCATEAAAVRCRSPGWSPAAAGPCRPGCGAGLSR
jgi:hypothetical protein